MFHSYLYLCALTLHKNYSNKTKESSEGRRTKTLLQYLITIKQHKL